MSAYISDDAKATQCATLLQALKAGPVSTIAAREVLGIASPAARVYSLRHGNFLYSQGLTIATKKEVVLDAAGRPHKVANYILVQRAKET